MFDITVVEDDENLREYMCVILQRAGFRVFPFDQIPNADDISHTEESRVLVSDIFLPNGSGIELTQAARSQFPKLKVLLISSDTATLRLQGIQVADSILAKPFTSAQLLQKVQALLASASRREYPKPRTD